MLGVDELEGGDLRRRSGAGSEARTGRAGLINTGQAGPWITAGLQTASQPKTARIAIQIIAETMQAIPHQRH